MSEASDCRSMLSVSDLCICMVIFIRRRALPLNHYSASRIWTLSVFVSFSRSSQAIQTEDTIIILDDVLTSVDSSHLDRFIELIHEEEQHFSQVILTTIIVLGEIATETTALRATKSISSSCGHGPSEGIRIQGMKLDLAELKGVLKANPFDRQTVASKAGIFLENALEFMARVYRCRLPLTAQSGYTLRELSDCFSKKLVKALKS